MRLRAESVHPDESIADVARRMLDERRLSFPVVDASGVVGVVGLEPIRRVAADAWTDTRIREVMSPAVVVAPEDKVREVLALLSGRGAAPLCVVSDGRLIGTLSEAEVFRGLKLRELDASQQRSSWGRREEGAARA
jgi:CBS domain-containing protein